MSSRHNPPELVHYLRDREPVFRRQLRLKQEAKPPDLLPEIIVTRKKGQQAQLRRQSPLTTTPAAPASTKRGRKRKAQTEEKGWKADKSDLELDGDSKESEPKPELTDTLETTSDMEPKNELLVDIISNVMDEIQKMEEDANLLDDVPELEDNMDLSDMDGKRNLSFDDASGSDVSESNPMLGSRRDKTDEELWADDVEMVMSDDSPEPQESYDSDRWQFEGDLELAASKRWQFDYDRTEPDEMDYMDPLELSEMWEMPEEQQQHENQGKLWTDSDQTGIKIASCWSLKRQPTPRLSTGKEQLDKIDGINILSFETERDLVEFTRIDHGLRKDGRRCETSSEDGDWETQPPSDDGLELADEEEEDSEGRDIMPTKTKDITKIKGWRRKQFAGHSAKSVGGMGAEEEPWPPSAEADDGFESCDVFWQQDNTEEDEFSLRIEDSEDESGRSLFLTSPVSSLLKKQKVPDEQSSLSTPDKPLGLIPKTSTPITSVTAKELESPAKISTVVSSPPKMVLRRPKEPNTLSTPDKQAGVTPRTTVTAQELDSSIIATTAPLKLLIRKPRVPEDKATLPPKEKPTGVTPAVTPTTPANKITSVIKTSPPVLFPPKVPRNPNVLEELKTPLTPEKPDRTTPSTVISSVVAGKLDSPKKTYTFITAPPKSILRMSKTLQEKMSRSLPEKAAGPDMKDGANSSLNGTARATLRGPNILEMRNKLLSTLGDVTNSQISPATSENPSKLNVRSQSAVTGFTAKKEDSSKMAFKPLKLGVSSSRARISALEELRKPATMMSVDSPSKTTCEKVGLSHNALLKTPNTFEEQQKMLASEHLSLTLPSSGEEAHSANARSSHLLSNVAPPRRKLWEPGSSVLDNKPDPTPPQLSVEVVSQRYRSLVLKKSTSLPPKRLLQLGVGTVAATQERDKKPKIEEEVTSRTDEKKLLKSEKRITSETGPLNYPRGLLKNHTGSLLRKSTSVPPRKVLLETSDPSSQVEDSKLAVTPVPTKKKLKKYLKYGTTPLLTRKTLREYEQSKALESEKKSVTLHPPRKKLWEVEREDSSLDLLESSPSKRFMRSSTLHPKKKLWETEKQAKSSTLQKTTPQIRDDRELLVSKPKTVAEKRRLLQLEKEGRRKVKKLAMKLRRMGSRAKRWNRDQESLPTPPPHPCKKRGRKKKQTPPPEPEDEPRHRAPRRLWSPSDDSQEFKGFIQASSPVPPEPVKNVEVPAIKASFGIKVHPCIGRPLSVMACKQLYRLREKSTLVDKQWAAFAVAVVWAGKPSATPACPDPITLMIARPPQHSKVLEEVRGVVRDLVSCVVTSELDSTLVKPDNEGRQESAPQPKPHRRRPAIQMELRRLNVSLIELSAGPEDKCECTQEFCRLGCVCVSLRAGRPSLMEHCGLVKCMFDCSCPSPGGILRHEDNLARVERQFKQTVVRSATSTIVLGGDGPRKRREIKLPERYRDEAVVLEAAIGEIVAIRVQTSSPPENKIRTLTPGSQPTLPSPPTNPQPQQKTRTLVPKNGPSPSTTLSTSPQRLKVRTLPPRNLHSPPLLPSSPPQRRKVRTLPPRNLHSPSTSPPPPGAPHSLTPLSNPRGSRPNTLRPCKVVLTPVRCCKEHGVWECEPCRPRVWKRRSVAMKSTTLPPQSHSTTLLPCGKKNCSTDSGEPHTWCPSNCLGKTPSSKSSPEPNTTSSDSDSKSIPENKYPVNSLKTVRLLVQHNMDVPALKKVDDEASKLQEPDKMSVTAEDESVSPSVSSPEDEPVTKKPKLETGTTQDNPLIRPRPITMMTNNVDKYLQKVPFYVDTPVVQQDRPHKMRIVNVMSLTKYSNDTKDVGSITQEVDVVENLTGQDLGSKNEPVGDSNESKSQTEGFISLTDLRSRSSVESGQLNFLSIGNDRTKKMNPLTPNMIHTTFERASSLGNRTIASGRGNDSVQAEPPGGSCADKEGPAPAQPAVEQAVKLGSKTEDSVSGSGTEQGRRLRTGGESTVSRGVKKISGETSFLTKPARNLDEIMATPGLGDRDPYQLTRVESLLVGFNSGSLQVWHDASMSKSEQEYLPLTIGNKPPYDGLVNLRDIVSWERLSNKSPLASYLLGFVQRPTDGPRLAVLRYDSSFWAAIGCVQRDKMTTLQPFYEVSPGEDLLPLELRRTVYSAVPGHKDVNSLRLSHQTRLVLPLPHPMVPYSRWYLLSLNRDFDFLFLTKFNTSVKHQDLTHLARAATLSGRTQCLPIEKLCYSAALKDPRYWMHPKFGMYSVPSFPNNILVGPYSSTEAPGINMLHWYRGNLHNSKRLYERMAMEASIKFDKKKLASAVAAKDLCGLWLHVVSGHDAKTWAEPFKGNKDLLQTLRDVNSAIDTHNKIAIAEKAAKLRDSTVPQLEKVELEQDFTKQSEMGLDLVGEAGPSWINDQVTMLGDPSACIGTEMSHRFILQGASITQQLGNEISLKEAGQSGDLPNSQSRWRLPVRLVPMAAMIGYLPAMYYGQGHITVQHPVVSGRPISFNNTLHLNRWLHRIFKRYLVLYPRNFFFKWILASAKEDIQREPMDKRILNGNYVLTPFSVFDIMRVQIKDLAMYRMTKEKYFELKNIINERKGKQLQLQSKVVTGSLHVDMRNDEWLPVPTTQGIPLIELADENEVEALDALGFKGNPQEQNNGQVTKSNKVVKTGTMSVGDLEDVTLTPNLRRGKAGRDPSMKGREGHTDVQGIIVLTCDSDKSDDEAEGAGKDDMTVTRLRNGAKESPGLKLVPVRDLQKQGPAGQNAGYTQATGGWVRSDAPKSILVRSKLSEQQVQPEKQILMVQTSQMMRPNILGRVPMTRVRPILPNVDPVNQKSGSKPSGIVKLSAATLESRKRGAEVIRSHTNVDSRETGGVRLIQRATNQTLVLRTPPKRHLLPSPSFVKMKEMPSTSNQMMVVPGHLKQGTALPGSSQNGRMFITLQGKKLEVPSQGKEAAAVVQKGNVMQIALQNNLMRDPLIKSQQLLVTVPAPVQHKQTLLLWTPNVVQSSRDPGTAKQTVLALNALPPPESVLLQGPVMNGNASQGSSNPTRAEKNPTKLSEAEEESLRTFIVQDGKGVEGKTTFVLKPGTEMADVYDYLHMKFSTCPSQPKKLKTVTIRKPNGELAEIQCILSNGSRVLQKITSPSTGAVVSDGDGPDSLTTPVGQITSPGTVSSEKEDTSSTSSSSSSTSSQASDNE